MVQRIQPRNTDVGTVPEGKQGQVCEDGRPRAGFADYPEITAAILPKGPDEILFPMTSNPA